MPVVYFPYRWLLSTVWPNISYGWWYFWKGWRNIAQWWRVIWHDQQGSDDRLLLIIEHKLRLMERVHGGHVGDEKQRRDMRVAAELCKRLAGDYVYTNHDADFNKLPCYFEKTRYRFYLAKQRHELRLLGKILGTKMLAWWC